MPDAEKVIDGLGRCISRESGKYTCYLCPYETAGNDCEIRLSKDAIALLREQEPIMVIWKEDIPFCGECRTAMSKTQDYCHKCGRKVKWVNG